MEAEDDEPTPVFEIRNHLIKSGPKKGETVKKILLIIGQRIFKKRRTLKNGNLVFTCNSCQKIGDYVSAIVAVEDEETDQYSVIRTPVDKDHKCWVKGNEADIKLAKLEMCEMVLEDPTRGLQDTGLPVFLLDGEECIVKGDQVFQDGRRILLFSTDEHLRILARAREILGDGTFRITPHLWCQTFIISANIGGSTFVPVAYCLLPDKKKESYLAMFSMLKEALQRLDLELAAEFFFSDSV